ncbi:hypothetical protein PHLGIDRAFT_125851 [Phlebiopsis gigantea 11061_1 CR5-6]|uniref:Coatomer subunit epsilon n=1 Tax=Phlebiopsis gigantea (strain 11061_1 CR5-6) TaxID=745531 RepID=A0A0C3SBG6_PHLG1|nr:hypothetical protein PHLGIDRAFT_125851 [Phlebiopsis gigantea 11061_1 CR5-6]
MDSSELYHVKQQFILGAYQSLVDLPLPSPNSPDYTPTLIYKARAHLALDDPEAALALLPESEDVALRAVAALARYLRDLCVEIEGEDGGARARWLVRVLAGTAFARAGEVEEALESLAAGSNRENLEAVAVTVQVYLALHRPDLARKELDGAKRWAEDDLLLQLIEASVSLVTGADAYADCHAFYTEQLANPSLSAPHLLTARGVARILQGEIPAARSDLEEVQTRDAETLAALVVAAGLSGQKGSEAEAEQLWGQLSTQYPSFPMVKDVAQKAELFDELAARFEVPPLAVAAA